MPPIFCFPKGSFCCSRILIYVLKSNGDVVYFLWFQFGNSHQKVLVKETVLPFMTCALRAFTSECERGWSTGVSIIPEEIHWHSVTWVGVFTLWRGGKVLYCRF